MQINIPYMDPMGVWGECRMSFFSAARVSISVGAGFFSVGFGKTLRYNNSSSSDRAAILARLNNEWFPCAFLLLEKK